jgi:hypothetical protein
MDVIFASFIFLRIYFGVKNPISIKAAAILSEG